MSNSGWYISANRADKLQVNGQKDTKKYFLGDNSNLRMFNILSQSDSNMSWITNKIT